MTDCGSECIVAIHLGAGHHSPDNWSELKKLMTYVCRETIQHLSKGMRAIDACALAISLLEVPQDITIKGSCLNIDGCVECDASIMDDMGAFGAVGAIIGVKNPITVARELALAHKNMESVLISPIFLVGQGAYRYAIEKGLETFLPSAPFEGPLVTQHAIQAYKSHMRNREGRIGPYDTIGAICKDREGHFAAGVSSGGISLKHSGRAAVFGAGCFSSHSEADGIRFACSSSGTGEKLLESLFSKSLCQQIVSRKEDCRSNICSDFLAEFMKGVRPQERIAAFVCLVEDELGLEVWFGHNADTLALGFMKETSDPNCQILAKPCNSPFVIAGESLCRL